MTVWITVTIGGRHWQLLDLDHPQIVRRILAEMDAGIAVYYDRRWASTERLGHLLVAEPHWVADRNVLVLGAGVWSARPTGPEEETLVVFGPHIPAAQAFDALSRADARVTWSDGAGGVWAVRLPATPHRLYADGAWLVTRSPVALGCVSFSRATSARRT